MKKQRQSATWRGRGSPVAAGSLTSPPPILFSVVPSSTAVDEEARNKPQQQPPEGEEMDQRSPPIAMSEIEVAAADFVDVIAISNRALERLFKVLDVYEACSVVAPSLASSK
nr:hypothetical protein Iba_chr05eCG9060 [Ipomoea batatas]GME21174.1 hypothetical protein Iba_scaffold27059CG0010 [Ipomoea batatas]